MRKIKSFADVVSLWDTSDEFAREIGVTSEATRKWKQRGRIPAEYWLPILGTKRARSARLTAETFMALARVRGEEKRA